MSKWYSQTTACHTVVAASFMNVKKHRKATPVLNSTVEVVNSLGIRVNKVWKPGEEGVISTNVVLQLHLFSRECEYKFVLTGQFVQDCLENLFVIRILKPAPSAYDLKNLMKFLSASQVLKAPKSIDDTDDSDHLVDISRGAIA